MNLLPQSLLSLADDNLVVDTSNSIPYHYEAAEVRRGAGDDGGDDQAALLPRLEEDSDSDAVGPGLDGDEECSGFGVRRVQGEEGSG